MVKSLVPGVVLIVTILSALINGALDGAQSLSLVLWTVAGVTILVILTRAYLIGTEIDRLGSEVHRHTVRAHILLHVIPLTYFPMAYGIVPDSMLEAIYLIPVIAFFITGLQTWKLCHGMFSTKLYRMFQIGNRQMLILFPGAFAIDIAGWPIEGAEAFSRLMHVYFIIHFMLTGITIPLMGRDLRRYAFGSPAPSKLDAAP